MAITQRQQKTVDGVPAAACWNCKASVAGGAHFCGTCAKIQPVTPGADYFSFFELPRKLTIDPGMLEGKFHMLSWKLHPDNFVRATEFERNLSLQRSSELNDAFRTLREPVGRVEYLLDFLGVRKEGTTKQQAPPELLEEVFELNESLDDLRDARASGGDTAALRTKLEAAQKNFQGLLAEVDADLASTARDWDAALDANADEATRSALLAKMGDLLNRRAYIRNLVAGVNAEMAA
jgi:molecular chaperone HscB